MKELKMDAKILHELLEYRDGELYWKKRRAGVQFNKPVGYVTKQGYKRVEANGKSYAVHRLVYMMFNKWLPEQLDHIDCNKLNNKIENLRPASSAENSSNRKLRCDNKYQTKNIYFDKVHEKWVVQVRKHGKSHYFGRYKDKNKASEVARMARDLLHGEFANHGNQE